VNAGTALVCLQNLRKTFKYEGRKNVPSIEEITAITAGRNSKRQIYRLPGGTERVINTKSTTVVQVRHQIFLPRQTIQNITIKMRRTV
jgi:myosin-15